MGGFHAWVRQYHHANFGVFLYIGQAAALFIQQVGGHRDRHDCANFSGSFLNGFFFQQAQDRERQRLGIANRALATTAGANDSAGFTEGGAQPLPRHLQQAETGYTSHLDPGAVDIECIAHAVFYRALVACGEHVDEVDYDQAAHVAQAQLAGDFISGFQVGVGRGFLDIATAGSTGGVDIDGDHGLGWVNNNGAAGWQSHLALESRFNLAFDLEAVEHRDRIFVELNPALVLGHDVADEIQRMLVCIGGIDHDLVDIFAQVIADGADDDIALLQEQGGGLFFIAGLLDRIPQLYQVVQVPLQFFCCATDTGGADDYPHAAGNFQVFHGVAQFAAVVAFDATGNTAGAGTVRHQDQVATGQADEGGQGRALIAALFLVHLHDNLGAFPDQLLDLHAAFAVAGLLGEVLAGDFLHWQETVTLSAELDKGCLQAGFNPGDLGFIDIGFLLEAGTILDIEVVHFLPVYEGDAQLFRLSCVD